MYNFWGTDGYMVICLQEPSEFWHAGAISQHLRGNLTDIELSPELSVAPPVIKHHEEAQEAGNERTSCAESCRGCKCWDIIWGGFGGKDVTRDKTHDICLKDFC